MAKVRHKKSIVSFSYQHNRNDCKYCNSRETHLSYGMWTDAMTVQDYEDLVNRGWRRIGDYCYKPTMEETCCPEYAIRCDALNFKLSKSHRKVIRHVNRFLIDGTSKMDASSHSHKTRDNNKGDVSDTILQSQTIRQELSLSSQDLNPCSLLEACREVSGELDSVLLGNISPTLEHMDPVADNASSSEILLKGGDRNNSSIQQPPSPGGADPNKPPSRKAKLMRLERKKMSECSGEKPDTKKQSNACKTLEDLLNELLGVRNLAHNLEVKLVLCSAHSDSFQCSLKESFKVYKKYQRIVHKEVATLDSFTEYLVNSPLQADMPGPHDRKLEHGYGTFHHQYILDGNIIAVGVLDILPHCLYSVYFYYDPDYSFLSLGTYSVLRELAFVREMQRDVPDLRYYTLGLYVHSCYRVRYKSQFHPSYLLCPETYLWIPLEKCIPRLDSSRYARLADESEEVTESCDDIGEVWILHKDQEMLFADYQLMKHAGLSYDAAKKYVSLVGRSCAQNMLLHVL